MTVGRSTRMTVAGVAIATIAAAGGRAIWQGSPPTEPSPMEEILAQDLAAPLEEAVTWDLPNERNERVDFWIDFLSGRNHDKTRLWLERIGRYGPFIRQELRARGMPEDLLYFAMIESGFSNRAYSRAAAVGMWQFISETGRRYGLDIGTYVDERRDPIASTHAALDYLQEMYGDFGSWYLAAAGYNSGENRVARILREKMGGATGSEELYWQISQHLPKETRDYVPLMLAAAHIAKDPEKYGFAGLQYQRPLTFEEVEVSGATSLSVIAKAALADEEEVRELNAHLVRGMTPPGRTFSVRIPVGTRQAFLANFERTKEEVRLASTVHEVRSGETLTHIARRYGTSVSALQNANGGLNPRRLQAGQQIVVPGEGAVLASATTEETAEPSWSSYRVRRGDTLSGIAQRHGVTVRDIQSWNGLGKRTRIRTGESLRIRA